jgi:glyoxylase-like metal-dependent hydrolase (beta-lactamase superfamily II)
MSKAFASQADLQEKKVTFTKLSDNAYAYTAEGDPNTGVIVGDDAVMVIDTQATPVMAEDVIRRIRQVTDKPVKYVVLSHYHAVRVLGASAYRPQEIIASQDTHDLIVERGAQDMQSEIERFPRLFRAVETIPGLTWPTMTFKGEMTVWLGKLEVKLLQLGRGHTKGDTVAWLPQQKILFSGDLVEFGATPYAGDAYFQDWPQTLDNIAALKPQKLVPGRGAALTTPELVHPQGLSGDACLHQRPDASVKAGAAAGKDWRKDLRGHACALEPRTASGSSTTTAMPFDVTRALGRGDAVSATPRIWTAERDKAMWMQLETLRRPR